MRRSLLVALLLSALFHLLVLAAPGWDIGSLMDDDDDDAVLIEAQLVAPAARMVRVPLPGPVPRKAAPVESVAVAPEAPAPAVAASDETVPAQGLDKVAANAPIEPVEPVAEPAVAPVPASEPEEIPEVAPLLPRSGRLHFSVMKSGFTVGKSVHEWRHDGKHYTLSAISQTTGLVSFLNSAKLTQTSEGSFLNGELKPDSFRSEQGSNEVVSASFDWKAQQVTLGNGQVVSIADGAEDFLSMFYQLMQAAQRGEGFIMAVATGRKVERYAFEWMGEEELALKPGRFMAWHVRVRAASGGKDTTEVWLGREVAGLPIKIRFTDRKGGVSEMVAEEIAYEK